MFRLSHTTRQLIFVMMLAIAPRTWGQTPEAGTTHWTEQAADGLWVVNVRNGSKHSVRLVSGRVHDCVEVGLGCGPTVSGVTIRPGETVRIASVFRRACTNEVDDDGRENDTCSQRPPTTFCYLYEAVLVPKHEKSTKDAGSPVPHREATREADDHARRRDASRAVDAIQKRDTTGDPNARQPPYGYTKLMLAARRQDLAEVQRLLLAGADPNLQANDGYTALMFAANSGNLDITKELLNAHADPNLRNEGGYTAIGIVGDVNPEMQRLLRQAGGR